MFGAVRDYLEEAYNPSVRGVVIILMGAGFALFMLLNSPDFTNPYYLFGVGVNIFAVIWAVITLTSVQINRR
ncbi:acyl-CoA dehydrogenase [Haloferax profundi]|uniref:Acyl-CoA dehydrogenase n=1 Tax=Haloferax profundi TaxID=1544718 RepID=A0A0W1SA12_9EURY|nr:acyl-CoA dehydrogenase [Haloferax profundi]